MKWDGYPNLRRRPPTQAKARGSIQRAIRRGFVASGAEALTSAQIYNWAYVRRRLGRCKTLPARAKAPVIGKLANDELIRPPRLPGVAGHTPFFSIRYAPDFPDFFWFLSEPNCRVDKGIYGIPCLVGSCGSVARG
jgi:hypothetical protein